jgi:hypothetical protein
MTVLATGSARRLDREPSPFTDVACSIAER